jgi:hypothetical protein
MNPRAIAFAALLPLTACGTARQPAIGPDTLTDCGYTFAVEVEDSMWYGTMDAPRVVQAIADYHACGTSQADCAELRALVIRQCDGAPAADPACSALVSSVVEQCGG